MEFIKNNILYVAWLQVLVGMLMSLYFSEIMKLPPCVFCWYQRIALYPMIVIIPVGILKKDKNDGVRLGVNFTPTLFISNKKVEVELTYQNLKAIIEVEMKQ